MKINPYLNFNGNCAEAFTYYEKVLGGKIEMSSTFGAMPAEYPCPPGWKDKILHISMSVGGDTLMGSDAPPDHYGKPDGFSVSLQIPEPAEATRVFEALSSGGSVQMPIQKTFWAKLFGMCVDKFGVPWMINCQ